MTDVHRLGHVRPRIVHQDLDRLGRTLVAQMTVLGCLIGPMSQGIVCDVDVDEAGPCDVGGCDLGMGCNGACHVFGDLPRRSPCLLGRGHRTVALELGQLGPLGGHDLAQLGTQAEVGEGLPGQLREMRLQRHGPSG